MIKRRKGFVEKFVHTIVKSFQRHSKNLIVFFGWEYMANPVLQSESTAYLKKEIVEISEEGGLLKVSNFAAALLNLSSTQ